MKKRRKEEKKKKIANKTTEINACLATSDAYNSMVLLLLLVDVLFYLKCPILIATTINLFSIDLILGLLSRTYKCIQRAQGPYTTSAMCIYISNVWKTTGHTVFYLIVMYGWNVEQRNGRTNAPEKLNCCFFGISYAPFQIYYIYFFRFMTLFLFLFFLLTLSLQPFIHALSLSLSLFDHLPWFSWPCLAH